MYLSNLLEVSRSVLCLNTAFASRLLTLDDVVLPQVAINLCKEERQLHNMYELLQNRVSCDLKHRKWLVLF